MTVGRLHSLDKTGIKPASAEVSSMDEGALLRALTSVDRQTDLAVNRTRRRVYSANLDMDQQKKDRRKQGRLVAVFCVAFLTLLTPVLWTSLESLLSGAHFADPQTQTFLLPLMLFPGIVAVATIAFKKHHDRESRREL
jgi:hypothetical protein